MENLHYSALHYILALSPIIVVLVLMVRFNWGGSKAGPVGLLTALVAAVLFFGAGPRLLAYSQVKAFSMSLYVLYVIWMALVLYNVVREAGAIDRIGKSILWLTGDRVLQLLILSWVFSSFLQGIAGYGVPIAVVAPLLIGLGFAPVTAVASAAVGHAWAVTFGSIAASFNTLIAASGLEGSLLAPWSAALLGIVCLFCGIAAAYSFEGWKSVRRGLPAILALGPLMAGVQYLLATAGLWNLAAFGAGFAGLAACILVAKLPVYRRQPADCPEPASQPEQQPGGITPTVWMSAAGYLILIFVVGVAELYPPAHQLLNQVKLDFAIPATQTSLGWIMKAGKTQSVSVFGHAGALLLYASFISYLLYDTTRQYQPGALKRILSNTVKSGLSSSIGIISMVGFAMIMEQSGMTNLLAFGMSQSIEKVFAFTSPFIGVLGSFMTGSNTNSNIVFAGLQRDTAALLKLPVVIILAAQTTGGSIGGMLAPARIIVGCSTAGLAGQEGKVLRKTIAYGLVITVLIGAIVWLITWLA